MNASEITKFLENLKPVIEKTQFDHLALFCTPKMIQICVVFLEGKHIRSIDIDCRAYYGVDLQVFFIYLELVNLEVTL